MNRVALLCLLASPALVAVACGSDDSDLATSDAGTSSGSATTSSGQTGSGSSSSSGSPSAPGCHATPAADDALRFMVASRPYGAINDAGTADMTKRFSSWSLSSTGTITALADFELGGYNTAGRIAFTPDGRLGAVALESRTQDDRGTVGVFRLDDAGAVTVVHANYKGAFFSSDTAFSPDGSTLFVSDTETNDEGGGLLAIPVACDGTLGEATRVTKATGTTVPSWAPGTTGAPWRALIAADALDGAPAGQGLHLFTFDGTTLARGGSADVFGQQTLIQDVAWAPDGTWPPAPQAQPRSSTSRSIWKAPRRSWPRRSATRSSWPRPIPMRCTRCSMHLARSMRSPPRSR